MWLHNYSHANKAYVVVIVVGYDISLQGTIQHVSGYDISLPSTKQQHTSYDLCRYRVRYISIGVRYNCTILVTIWGYRVRRNSVPVTIQHHRVRHDGIPGTLRQYTEYTGKFDTIHLIVRYNNFFVQYSLPSILNRPQIYENK